VVSQIRQRKSFVTSGAILFIGWMTFLTQWLVSMLFLCKWQQNYCSTRNLALANRMHSSVHYHFYTYVLYESTYWLLTECWKPVYRLSFSLQCNDFEGLKSNVSGISLANPNHSRPNLADMHRSRGDNVQDTLAVISIVGKTGARTSLTQPGLSVFQMRQHFLNYSMADFHQNWPQLVNPCPLKTLWKGFLTKFPFAVICPQKSQR